MQKINGQLIRGAKTFSKLGFNSLVEGITTLQKKIDRSTQFGTVGYIIFLVIKKLRKKLGVRPNCGEVPIPQAPVVAPMQLISIFVHFGVQQRVISLTWATQRRT